MKLYKIFFLIGVLLIPSCDETSITISNPTEPNPIYEFNLAFTEDTDNSDTIILTWTKNADITAFNIEIMDLGINEPSNNPDNFTFPLLPGLFTDVIISADDVLTDTIKVFSSPMAPSTFEPDDGENWKISEPIGGATNEFSWIPSEEPDIETIKLYKCNYHLTDNFNIECPPTPHSSLLNTNFTIIETFDPENYFFSEPKIFNEKNCYIMETTDLTGDYRYSQIICTHENGELLDDMVNILSISNDLENKIRIQWDEYDESDFYQYTLYRSENADINEENRIKLAKIIYEKQTVFEDRNDISDGVRYYYQIEVHSQYGGFEKSNIESGKSKP